MAMSRKEAQRRADKLRKQKNLSPRRKSELAAYESFLTGKPITTKRDYTEGERKQGSFCFRQLAQGKPRLGIRLAQRWVKLQLGVLVPA